MEPVLPVFRREAFVHMTWVVQRLRLALSKGPYTFPSPEDGNRSSLRNVMFSSYLEFRTMDRVLKTE
jgi:hypothetical protein